MTPGLDSVVDDPVEHADTTDARVEGDADAAVPVVGRSGDLVSKLKNALFLVTDTAGK